jgi:hypothetical protein
MRRTNRLPTVWLSRRTLRKTSAPIPRPSRRSESSSQCARSSPRCRVTGWRGFRGPEPCRFPAGNRQRLHRKDGQEDMRGQISRALVGRSRSVSYGRRLVSLPGFRSAPPPASGPAAACSTSWRPLFSVTRSALGDHFTTAWPKTSSSAISAPPPQAITSSTTASSLPSLDARPSNLGIRGPPVPPLHRGPAVEEHNDVRNLFRTEYHRKGLELSNFHLCKHLRNSPKREFLRRGFLSRRSRTCSTQELTQRPKD